MKFPFSKFFPNSQSNRAGRSFGRALTDIVTSFNRNYRDNLNPARGLTISHAVSLVESYPRGEFADLMWTFGAPFCGIECADADLVALIERRLTPLLEMDWNSQIVDREGIDDALAADQQAFVRERMDGIVNLYAAIEHLGLASFRGFAHCEPIYTASGSLRELRPVQQWNVVREGSRGQWRYNPEAKQTSYRSLGADMDIDPGKWLIRECPRPIHRVSLVKYVRENLSQKDWDAFVEIYGIPGGVVIGPPNVPENKEQEYQDGALTIAEGGNGYLPHGSQWMPSVLPRGNQPFREHLEFLSQKLILAGTGGLLTMLAQSGSGTLAGSAHMETFKTIARGEARRISELIDAQVVRPALEYAFPGKPVLAYWALAANEEIKVGEIVDHAVKLSHAGYRIDVDELSEKSGYKLSLAPATDFSSLLSNSNRPASDANGLQTRDLSPSVPTPAGASPETATAQMLKLAQRGNLSVQMTDLLERMERGESSAVEEALQLISKLGPEALNDIEPLTRLITRAAEEAAVMGAVGTGTPFSQKNAQ